MAGVHTSGGLAVGSLASGYGGFERAAEQLMPGLTQPVWFTDPDPDAAHILKVHHPDVPNHGDITTIDWATMEPVDLLLMGVPCQPVSSAGRHGGVNDSRWLWPAALDCITALPAAPEEIWFENVEGLAASRHRHILDGITRDLNALGYNVAWTVHGACRIGACHHRHRLFLVARIEHRPQWPFTIGPVATTCTGRARHQPKLLPTVTASEHFGPGHTGDGGLNLRTVIARLPPPTDDLDARFGPYATAVRSHAALLGTPPPEPAEHGPRGGVRLTTAFSEWMMGLPPGFLAEHLPRRAVIERAGNGVMPHQAAAAIAELRLALNARRDNRPMKPPCG